MKSTCAYGVAPRALPVIGHALPLLRDPLGFLAELPRHGDLVQVRVGRYRAVVVCDPELTRQVLRDDRTFDKGGPLYDRIRELTGNGLASCPYSDHRRQRRLLQPAFHPARMPGYAETMRRQVTAATGAWTDGEAVDAIAEMHGISARTTIVTMFGRDPARAAADGDLARLMEDFTVVVAGIPRRTLLPPSADRLPTPANLRYDRARARLRTAIDRIVAGQRSGELHDGDLLSMLLSAGHDPPGNGGPGGPGLTDEEIADQLVTFFAAGTENTGTTLAWALHLLARHPHVARRMRAEVDTVLDGAPAASLEHLPALKLTTAVVTEALRLYPPAWVLTRTTTEDTRLGGHPIPAGTAVVYSAYLLHRRPDLFPDPERFDPDRWMTGSTPRRSAFVPFGGGPRKCIGDVFALTEATLVLATVSAGWELRPVDDRPVRPVPRLALSPQELPMRTVARARSATAANPSSRR
ncbi:cytochrome P450 [Streptomyces sp. AV19]|uniref:cytochrome P450 n=1 Tax=Streptomyces sp. AV19 TaxID=2793068 RepID=UPI0018FF0E46|nr:cytochrome P450 [Streptomyces sp. AV19]MBH1937600.1 cytochrome P450 [Streptomyces sp. AV19]MDG4536467.1 cytochrome P450 [Streptomyces sp. AV19]